MYFPLCVMNISDILGMLHYVHLFGYWGLNDTCLLLDKISRQQVKSFGGKANVIIDFFHSKYTNVFPVP